MGRSKKDRDREIKQLKGLQGQPPKRSKGQGLIRFPHGGRQRSEPEPDPPTSVGELDLTRREFAILIAAMAVVHSDSLLVSPLVGATEVTARELDEVWNKVSTLGIAIDANDDETMERQVFSSYETP